MCFLVTFYEILLFSQIIIRIVIWLVLGLHHQTITHQKIPIMSILIFLSVILLLVVVSINSEYNRAARTPGTKIYEARKR